MARKSNGVSRRSFMKKAGRGIAAAPLAGLAGPAGAALAVRLGIDLFSIRSQGWDAFQFLDYAAQHGVRVVHFSEPRFLGGLEEPHLRKVKSYADQKGLAIEVGLGCICPSSKRFNVAEGTAEQQLTRFFKVAKLAGSPIVRVYLGSWQDREGGIEPHIESTAAVLRGVRSRALDMGLKIAVENHAGDLQAREMKALIEEAGRDFVGSCLDAGNPVWAVEDPHFTLETLAPYVLTTHVRDSAVWEEPDKGIAVQWTAMGEGTIGIDRWVRRYAELCPGKPLSLEIIETRQPRIHNYLDPAFWTNYPATPAAEFARFLKLAREGSPRYPADPPRGAKPDSAAFKAFAVEQERAALDRSIAYCKTKLGVA